MFTEQRLAFDPRVKVYSFIVGVSLAFICNDLYSIILLISSLIIFMLTSSFKSSMLRWLKAIGPPVIMAFALWAFLGEWSLFHGQNGFRIGLAAFIGARLFFLLLLSLCFVTSIKPGEIMAIMRWLRVPKNMGMVVALSFKQLYVVAEEYRAVKEALLTKGLELDRGSLARRIKNHAYLLIPLLLRSIENADRLVLAIKLRPPSTYGRKLNPLTPLDKLAILSLSAALILGVLHYIVKVL
ncbi:MAG: energy-coupling factor transporter transmembrane component T [Nitrososphaerota archaeon]